jgi:uncharacterized protein (TIGR02145 family)
VALAAQNGVTVSGLSVNAGTVTFNVSWDRDAMPSLWSDSVWVFVDYNNAGGMTRLPVTDVTASAGTVIKVDGNDKGAWVIGNARTNGSFSATVQLLTATADIAGACAYASNYPPVGEYYNNYTEIAFTGTPMYDLVLEHTNGSTITVQSGNTFLLPCDYTLTSFTDATTGAPGIVPYMPQGTAQPQGSCTYTEPAAVGTFASFQSNYSASSYVTLTDERDNKNYPVVKIGGRWIMARNLNYQGTNSANTLTWQTASNQPSTGTGSNTALIGNFWCPGSGATSTRASCEVWGALYTWETAMMVDGKWSDDNRNTTTWSNPTADAGNYVNINGGKGANGHGICPTNWHVPTDAEWADIFDTMEGSGTAHRNGSGFLGTNAGKYAKSACTGTATDSAPLWTDNANRGTDVYGFRGLPAGYRDYNGSPFDRRGTYAYVWSSSASDGTNAWYRHFRYDLTPVYRFAYNRSYGFYVRCIR